MIFHQPRLVAELLAGYQGFGIECVEDSIDRRSWSPIASIGRGLLPAFAGEFLAEVELARLRGQQCDLLVRQFTDP